MSDIFTTDEGFVLPKPLVFPDVHDFRVLFTVDGAWDFATMNHRNGVAPPGRPKDMSFSTGVDERIAINRFMSVRVPGRPHFVVTPTDSLLSWIRSTDTFAFWDHIGWEAIHHEASDRVLVLATCTSLISSRWLAYVHTDTVPNPLEV